ncbi:MAG: DUF1178 family protein [Gammaproteobacteria bacterium]|uniref:DUF1178 family protein n=1 Tax=Rhodoferax sp. TaxID=50421 RepID=UPI001859AD26|nr:DUF1178 family protein [Rhodoferax sp.]MBU3897950.1 DUF1178 family protein [Gammaproteobacteria bacterium]MBA3056876.1 DUF1178 family protein [Rhodoferax sp.]MBU3996309.1 DUF1178 family protein [Gammaproteobacteria bacterium]MBU4018611.1 DUF1178 family protein [Gammaproteobacteria bacterium]MBU4080846.1 DUF1178 family protein [Gammaproteobacteria bacterium]
MKVLDLHCRHQHVFEGWFASEDDFLDQCKRAQVQCPVCGDAAISKRLSAPRLNLAGARGERSRALESSSPQGAEQAMQQAWMALAHRIVANTDDVGENFAEEARKMHYGEAQERSIRGQASRAEAESLIEEGIAVISLSLPAAFKGTLQ